MVRRITPAVGAAAAVLCLAATLAAQQYVDQRVDLMTQPLYAPFSRTPYDYSALPMYGLDNVRFGRAFMGRRNFLEDRYFSGPLTQFYRDTVGVQDVRSGITFGAGVPYFHPGSLGARGSTVSYSAGRAADPFGLVPSVFSTQSFVSSVTPWRTVVPSVQYEGPLAAPGGPSLLRGTEPGAQPAPTAPFVPLVPQTRWPSVEPAEQRGEPSPAWPRSAPPAEGMGRQGERKPGEPKRVMPFAPGPKPGVERGVQPEPAVPFDVFHRQFTGEYFGPEGSLERRPELERMELLRRPEEGAAESEAAAGPEAGLAPGRPRKLDEQYYQLALIDLEAGAYRHAAEAFGKVVHFNPARRWEAERGEGLARLLSGDYYSASHLLSRTLVDKPELTPPEFRLTEIVSQVKDWQAAETALAAILKETPTSASHAFAMAYLKTFLGRAEEALPWLGAAEKKEEFAAAAKLLREKGKPSN